MEGCECNPGFVLSGLQCVPRSQCGCLDSTGSYFMVSRSAWDSSGICRKREGSGKARACRPGLRGILAQISFPIFFLQLYYFSCRWGWNPNSYCLAA